MTTMTRSGYPLSRTGRNNSRGGRMLPSARDAQNLNTRRRAYYWSLVGSTKKMHGFALDDLLLAAAIVLLLSEVFK